MKMRLTLSSTLWITSVALLAACSADNTGPGLTNPGSADVISVNRCDGPATSFSSTSAATSPMPTIDEQWAQIARTNPGGFAGIVTNAGSSNPVVLLTDKSALKALIPILSATYTQYDFSKAEARQVRWNSAQLLGWYYYLMGVPIWSAPGVTSSDIDEVANRIRLNAADAAGQAVLVQRLQGLHLPCELVNVGIMEPATID